jgi:hypothetical protein
MLWVPKRRHKADAEQVLTITPGGLTAREAERRTNEHGPNESCPLKCLGLCIDMSNRLTGHPVVMYLV